MKYSYVLLITLVISMIWGLLLFILGCVVRFQQAMLLNQYLEGLESQVNVEVCERVLNSMTINLCAIKTKFDSFTIGDWANMFGAVMIVTGFIVIFLSASGFVGVMKKSQILLLLMLVLIIVAIGLEYYIIDISLGTTGSFHQSAKEEMIERISSEYTVTGEPTEFTRMLNAVMLQAECCGISGPEDFSVNETLIINGNRRTIKVPPSCCDREDFSQNSNQAGFQALMQCAEDSWSIRSVQLGCYSVIHKTIYDVYGAVLIGFLMFLILWEGLQGILLFMIILKPRPKSPKKSMASSVGSMRAPAAINTTEVGQKKFIPHTRASSFVHSDINRTESTEIW